jgi:mono/diheme cytochrome c family protein
VQTIADLILHPPAPPTKTTDFTAQEKKEFAAGQETFNNLCAACHGLDGRGVPLVGAAPGTKLAPSFADATILKGRREGPILVLLHGLTGDIEGKKYEGQMISMATNNDEWIANVLSYVRNSFGNRAGFISAKEVAAVRAATAARTQPWSVEELMATLPQPLPNRQAWKLSASHNAGSVKNAIDGKIETRFDTHTFQVPNMWFQIELPAETEIAGLLLDTSKSANDYPREYKVETSTDGQTWGKPIATGKGTGSLTNIEFPPVKTKFIRITQLGKAAGNFWSIHELQIFAPAKLSASVVASKK